ncbi:MAG TPA: hypothetical protein P5315_10855, partial [Clostridia bacterium]|nr:hypothetical protein [Clostridia bacterium]
MMSDRQYRQKLGLDIAKQQLLVNSGNQFDADIVKNFLDMITDFDTFYKDLKEYEQKSMNKILTA